MKKTQNFLLIFLFLGTAVLVLNLRLETPRLSAVSGIFTQSYPRLPLALDREEPQVLAKTEVLEELDLTARAVLVKDISSGQILYEKNVNLVLPIASLTKLMTALVTEKQASLEALVEISPFDLLTEKYVINLVPGENLRVYDLLQAMLISSANDATLALARFAGKGSIEKFVIMMNKEAVAFGMPSTAFTNPVGFDDPAHYSSAADLAKLVEEFLQHPRLLEIVGRKKTLISSSDGAHTHELVTTNKLLLQYEEITGIKTGYTAEAKGNLIALVDNKYYSIILGSSEREEETEKIMNWVTENFAWR